MASARSFVVWDLPVRLFHWSLVVAIGICWWTGENGPVEIHALAGYAALALLIFRILWGLAGSETARLRPLLRSPRDAVAHAAHLISREPLAREIGHNALGGFAVLGLLLLVALVAITGLFLYDDAIFWGPLNALVGEEMELTMSKVHHLGWEALLIVIAIHVAAVFYYLLVKRLDLVTPMVSGRADFPGDIAAPRTASVALALAFGLAAAAFVWALVTFGPGLG